MAQICATQLDLQTNLEVSVQACVCTCKAGCTRKREFSHTNSLTGAENCENVALIVLEIGAGWWYLPGPLHAVSYFPLSWERTGKILLVCKLSLLGCIQLEEKQNWNSEVNDSEDQTNPYGKSSWELLESC